MGRTQLLRRGLSGGFLVVAAASAVVVPLASSADGPSPSPIPQGCQLRSPQPEAPLELNVVAVKNLAKTIAVEKEVFSCFDSKSNLAQIKTVDTTVEIAKRGSTGASPTLATIGKSIETDTCVKDLQTGRVSCKAETVPLGTTETPLTGCQVTKSSYPFAPVQQPTHPLGMGTVALDDGLVDTTQVEKEVFDCRGQIGDVYLFTDLIEAENAKGFHSVGTHFDGVVCLKDEATAKLVACRLFTPGSGA